MSLSAGKKERFHFLDGLRGIASLMIVFHHAFTANIFRLLAYLKIPVLGYFLLNFTQSGVELFFVLSGVVLLRPYLRNQRKFKTVDYFFRRFKRIYPSYFFALVFAAFVIWFINTYPTWYNTLGNRMQFSWMETFKELFIFNFDGAYYNLAWWSLGIEMLFYVLVPFCVFLFLLPGKLTGRNITVMILVTLLVSTAVQLWLTKYHPEVYSYKHLVANIFQFVCYPVCFLAGILLAARDFGLKAAYCFIVPGILLITASWGYLPLVNPGYGLVYAGVVILSFNKQGLKRFLSKPIMIWLGERSYSLFLVHFSVFYFMDNIVAHFTSARNMSYGILTRGIGVPLALFVAMLLFHFVERRQAHGLVTGNIFWPWHVNRLNNKLED